MIHLYLECYPKNRYTTRGRVNPHYKTYSLLATTIIDIWQSSTSKKYYYCTTMLANLVVYINLIKKETSLAQKEPSPRVLLSIRSLPDDTLWFTIDSDAATQWPSAKRLIKNPYYCLWACFNWKWRHYYYISQLGSYGSKRLKRCLRNLHERIVSAVKFKTHKTKNKNKTKTNKYQPRTDPFGSNNVFYSVTSPRSVTRPTTIDRWLTLFLNNIRHNKENSASYHRSVHYLFGLSQHLFWGSDE
jgi:hypothetical protein